MQVPDLECLSLNKSFNDFRAVRDVSFSVPPGTFFSILGPSGCGKTTLLRMIAGFITPTSGDLQIKGKSVLDIAPNRRQVSMVFQHLALFPMMDIAANVGFGLRQRGIAREDIAKRVEKVLARVGLPGIGNRRIDQLSGGQKQRVAIARCMVLEPDVLLLDEPLGALDLKLREHMKIELKKLQSEFGTTFVYITHDQSEALVMSDQIAVMNHGIFEQVGTAKELYYEPHTNFVAGFIGEANRFQGKVTSAKGNALKIVSDEGFELSGIAANASLSKGDRAEIFVRPEASQISEEAFKPSDTKNSFKGRVENILFNGANSHVLMRDVKTGKEFDVAIPQTGQFKDLRRSDTLYVEWAPNQTLCYPAITKIAKP